MSYVKGRGYSPNTVYRPQVIDNVMTDEQKDALFLALERQFEFDLRKACETARIPRATYEKAVKDDPQFAARVASYRGNLLKQLEDKCMAIALTGDGAMARFVLQAEMPEKYAPRRSQDAPKVESPEQLKNMTDEELDELLKG